MHAWRQIRTAFPSKNEPFTRDCPRANNPAAAVFDRENQGGRGRFIVIIVAVANVDVIIVE